MRPFDYLNCFFLAYSFAHFGEQLAEEEERV